MTQTKKIAIIGLGYVGLPLAVAFSKKYQVLGFDIHAQRVNALTLGQDDTLEVSVHELKTALKPNKNIGLRITKNPNDLAGASIYIVTVPTPITTDNKPDFRPLLKACETVGRVLKLEDIVIFESTVYPGVTEDICVPILEQHSGLKFNTGFFVGYSPERINPGDKKHTLTKILKVTSGSTPDSAQEIDALYRSIIVAGTYLAPSIKVAEAAKVIENSQRDINIAFVNELSKIFRRLDIDTQAVLEAAGTKWNFLKFTPGLVGGHCIGVDPYYLAEKAMQSGYNPEIILAGRRMNDSMGAYVAQETVKLMLSKETVINNANVLILGITFKENCPDIRNSRVIDVINEFKSFSLNVDVYDPWASMEAVKREYGLELLTNVSHLKKDYDAVVFAVAHDQFLDFDLEAVKGEKAVVFDVKGQLKRNQIDGRL